MSDVSFNHLRASRLFWWLVVITGLATLGFGAYGVWQYDHAYGPKDASGFACALGSLYHALQMLFLHTPHFENGANSWIEAGRWCGAFTLIATTGMLLWKRLLREFRLVGLAGWSGHHVVCGLGQKGMEVIRSLKDKRPPLRVLVIDPRPDERWVEDCGTLGVCVITGDARESKVLEQARVNLASEVIVITPEDETNVHIAIAIRNACAGKRSGTVACFVHLANIHLRERLQTLTENATGKQTGCALSFFDVFDNEARRVLTSLPLDGEGISADSPCSVHVVLLGFGRMGCSVALRAAKMGHFANRKPLRISVIDRQAKLRREHFLCRHPALEKNNSRGAAICELDFYETDAESLTARKYLECWASEPDTVLHLFVCVDENTRAIELGLRYQEALVAHAHCNLLVRIKTRFPIAGVVDVAPTATPRIRVFGMVEDGCCEQAFRHEQNEALARAAHKDFVQKRLTDSNRKPERDPALVDWDQLRDDFRESNRQQADHAAIKLRAIGCEMVEESDGREAVEVFTNREIELLAEMEHTRWNAGRWLAGWRYGTPSKKESRISDNLCSWGDLHDSIKKYDCEAVANIPGILRLAAPPMKVVRLTAQTS